MVVVVAAVVVVVALALAVDGRSNRSGVKKEETKMGRKMSEMSQLRAAAVHAQGCPGVQGWEMGGIIIRMRCTAED